MNIRRDMRVVDHDMNFSHDGKSGRKPRILVVDDSKLNRAIVKKTLVPLAIEVAECADGQEALDLLVSANFDLILVDIIMPRVDGFEFIQRFRAMQSRAFVPVVLMTGLEDLDNKIMGLNIGADDFLMKPLNDKELAARVNSLLRLKGAHDELFAKNEMIRRELAIAKRVQQFIIPGDFSRFPSPLITGRYLPIEDIGGDYFDAYQLENGGVGMVIADVTGHGIPAAMVMTMSKMIFSVYAAEYASTSMLMARVNREMRGLLLDGQYITAFYLIYYPESMRLFFTNAGHCAPLYYRKRTDRVFALDTKGLFIGIMDGTEYEEKAIDVESGDALLLFTDGITEIRNGVREEYGEKRLARFLRMHHELAGDAFCDGLLGEIGAFAELESRADDLAFLYVKF